MPENAWFARGEVVISTDPDVHAGDVCEVGSTLVLAPRTLVLLRAV